MKNLNDEYNKEIKSTFIDLRESSEEATVKNRKSIKKDSTVKHFIGLNLDLGNRSMNKYNNNFLGSDKYKIDNKNDFLGRKSFKNINENEYFDTFEIGNEKENEFVDLCVSTNEEKNRFEFENIDEKENSSFQVKSGLNSNNKYEKIFKKRNELSYNNCNRFIQNTQIIDINQNQNNNCIDEILVKNQCSEQSNNEIESKKIEYPTFDFFTKDKNKLKSDIIFHFLKIITFFTIDINNSSVNKTVFQGLKKFLNTMRSESSVKCSEKSTCEDEVKVDKAKNFNIELFNKKLCELGFVNEKQILKVIRYVNIFKESTESILSNECSLTTESFLKLLPNKELNDEIINFIIKKRFNEKKDQSNESKFSGKYFIFNTYFFILLMNQIEKKTLDVDIYGKLNNLDFFVKKFFKNIPISTKLFFIPCLINNHWFLILVNIINERINIYDSLSIVNHNPFLRIAIEYIADIINAFLIDKSIINDPLNFDVNLNSKCPFQKNDYDCGIFMIQIIEDLIKCNLSSFQFSLSNFEDSDSINNSKQIYDSEQIIPCKNYDHDCFNNIIYDSTNLRVKFMYILIMIVLEERRKNNSFEINDIS